MMSGQEFEREIRLDAVRRVIRTLEANLLLNDSMALNWGVGDEDACEALRRLRARLHPGKEPVHYTGIVGLAVGPSSLSGESGTP